MLVGSSGGRKVGRSEVLTGTLGGDTPASASCVCGTLVISGMGMLGGRLWFKGLGLNESSPL